VLLVAGQSTPVTVTRNSATKVADVSGPGFTMRLYGVSPEGGSLGFTSSGALVIEQDRQVRIEGAGFQPNSPVTVYMFSTPVSLGTVTTDSYGNFSGAVPVPTTVAPGAHTVQVNGYSTSGQVRSLSMLAELRSDSRNASATVAFKGKGTKLTKKAKKKLDALVRRTKATAVTTTVLGSVGPGARNATPLARARLAAVISYLQSRGLAGDFVTKPYGGKVLKQGTSAKRTTVTVTF
jgi:outer membrane protein OmpA-like peptidoglycan-associated protein